MEDNWDDDFASAISPRALELPHLRPQDHLGGLLSSERLKAFASSDGPSVRDASDNSVEGEATLKAPVQSEETDPLQTIRPVPRKPSKEEDGQQKGRSRRTTSKGSYLSIPILGRPATPQPRPPRQAHPAAFYEESAVEDYSDLIEANDDVLERKLGVFQVITLMINASYQANG